MSEGGFIAGALVCVITPITPDAASAAVVSIVAARPFAIVLHTSAA
jgi:hypothetical protein